MLQLTASTNFRLKAGLQTRLSLRLKQHYLFLKPQTD